MGSETFAQLTKAGGAAYKSVTQKWQERKNRQSTAVADEQLAAAVREKNDDLQRIAAKVAGDSAAEMTPLVCQPQATYSAVFLITTPIAYGKFELSRRSYELLGKHVGMSMNSVSHWAVCVINRGLGVSYTYDLMSDQLELAMLGKNYFRVYEVTDDFIASWSSCYYVGETTKKHEEIQEHGQAFIAANQRYKVTSNNCQHLAGAMVQDLCNGKVISQAKLDEELRLVSPKMARDLMVAKLRSRFEVEDQKEDSDSVKHDVDSIKELWSRIKHRPSQVDSSLEPSPPPLPPRTASGSR
ncbi:hypothetical protein P153DRAFT_354515 [Dothidotthia symphoricarpi CBS 119687]|uniref:PPPDE domain-containing protein n=1 Tax=Dothidotthia symphoricarpi CBS 119687 TaxID=1392245 RepID=A0A6A6AIN2_9PLEO|nr:uncharacterized protein P153DRAFT_354515 [Dothidotthia symphoricarpi CBS 119687]KAF2131819.1 hypothetical protein P153DRAFT_354515 [Dothidotthia symphoricarpi CBS 119687]